MWDWHGSGGKRETVNKEVYWWSDRLDSDVEAKGKFKEDLRVSSPRNKNNVAATAARNGK